MNKSLNLRKFELLVEPWVGLADDDLAIVRFRGVDPNNETSIKALLRSDIVPWLKEQDAVTIFDVRKAVKELCKTNIPNWNRVWDSLLPPFCLPNEPQLFLQWLDQVLDEDDAAEMNPRANQ